MKRTFALLLLFALLTVLTVGCAKTATPAPTAENAVEPIAVPPPEAAERPTPGLPKEKTPLEKDPPVLHGEAPELRPGEAPVPPIKEEPRPPKPEPPVRPVVEAPLDGMLSVCWGEEAPKGDSDWETFEVPGGEAEIVFLAGPQSLREFKILELTFRDVDDKGNARYDLRTLYELPELRGEKPLRVKTTFAGAIPNNGVSYVESDGSTRYFTVQVSGENGALLLEEFHP